MYRIDGKFIKNKIIENMDNSGGFSAKVILDEDDVTSVTNLKNTIVNNITDLNIDGLTKENIKITNVKSVDDKSDIIDDVTEKSEFDDFKICIDNTCLNIDQIKKFKEEMNKYDCLK